MMACVGEHYCLIEFAPCALLVLLIVALIEIECCPGFDLLLDLLQPEQFTGSFDQARNIRRPNAQCCRSRYGVNRLRRFAFHNEPSRWKFNARSAFACQSRDKAPPHSERA